MTGTPLQSFHPAKELGGERCFSPEAIISRFAPQAHLHVMHRFGLRLLTRTIRSVWPMEAGERLLQSVGPWLDQFAAEVGPGLAFRTQ